MTPVTIGVMSLAASLLRIDPRDDVAVAVRGLAAGDSVADGVTARAEVPAGHKVALRAVAKGEPVRKYGWPIGRATADIAAGDHVHTHNLTTSLAGLEAYSWEPAAPEPLPAPEGRTFLGYRRRDGRVGTRNEIWVLCTVGCVARTAQKIAEAANRRFAGRVDGVVALTHPFGCSQLGGDLDATRTMTAALAGHPNAGGVLIIGLGCESNQLGPLLEEASLDPERLRAFTAQSAEDELEAGLAAVEELVRVAERDVREPCPVSDLVVGLKCGGSDGLSGLTANPLVGRIADKVSAEGGSAILTEIPEIFGAERLLMARAASEAVYQDVARVVNDFKSYFLGHGEPVSENPSPGNIAGGITTLEEKSLGAVQKAGRAPVTEVVRYGGRIHGKPGVALLEAPGNDAVSSTALTAAGATVILFTTGRGTPLGFPAPTLKLATNSGLAQRKPHWIDFDAGRIAAGEPIERTADALMDLIVATASGRPTRAEENGEREIALWKRGVTL